MTMQSGYSEPAELFQRLETLSSISFRAALQKDGDKWSAHTLLLEHVPERQEYSPPAFDYRYGDVHFIAGAIAGEAAVHWLYERQGELRPAGKSGSITKFVLPALNGKLPWTRYPSYSTVDYATVPWPITRYDATGSRNPQLNEPQGMFTADDAPFFPDFRTALLRLIYGAPYPSRLTNASTSQAVIIRDADIIAWLDRITLSPTAISVTVGGARVTGVKLSIRGEPDVEFEQVLNHRGTFSCPLTGGPPSPLWIVLSRGNTTLDYYHRDERWTAYNAPQANITLDPGDVRNEIEGLIAQGEGPEVEFKREFGEEKKRFLSAISAFANTAGGTIIVGISDDGRTHGIQGDVNVIRDSITRSVRDSVVPMPTTHITASARDGLPILAVYVEPTLEHPCGVYPADPHYYVRRGANNFPARPEEITNLILSRHPSSSPLRYLNG